MGKKALISNKLLYSDYYMSIKKKNNNNKSACPHNIITWQTKKYLSTPPLKYIITWITLIHVSIRHQHCVIVYYCKHTVAHNKSVYTQDLLSY